MLQLYNPLQQHPHQLLQRDCSQAMAITLYVVPKTCTSECLMLSNFALYCVPRQVLGAHVTEFCRLAKAGCTASKLHIIGVQAPCTETDCLGAEV